MPTRRVGAAHPGESFLQVTASQVFLDHFVHNRPKEPVLVTVLDVSEHRPRRAPSKTWRELIKKIWEVDPLSCPRCGNEMKIISLINRPKLIERILRHLGLWRQHPDPDQEKTKAPVEGPVVMEDFDDGWPGYESPVFVHP